MATYLFAWNPNKYNWTDHDITKKIRRVAATGSAKGRWSCGNRKELPESSRFFLIRLGMAPKGIVGSGQTTSTPKPDKHYDANLKRTEALYVGLKFDFLSREPIVTMDELQEAPYSEVSWSIQASGVHLPEDVAHELEKLWLRRVGGVDPFLPEEIPADTSYPEGARRNILVNAYERNPQARAACIAHFGFQCSVCDLLLEERYGSIAAGFIHVHHKIPVASVGENYRVDPKKDLCPVCPNCHAVIHRRTPPLSVAEARKLIREA